MTEIERKEVTANLERAEASLEAARELLTGLYPDFAASRAYYAAFYAATALLMAEGLAYRKHSGVVAEIHRRFVKSGMLDKQHGRNLNWLFELRGVGDYGGMLHVSGDEALAAIEAATKFVQATKELIDDGTA